MNPWVTLAIYLAPFLLLAIAVRFWMRRKGVGLAETRSEGGARHHPARFLLGVWRKDDPP